MRNNPSNNYPAAGKPASNSNARSSLITQNPHSPFTFQEEESGLRASQHRSPQHSGPAREAGGRRAASSSGWQERSGKPGSGQSRPPAGAGGSLRPGESRIAPELLGLLCILFAALLFISLASFNPADPSLNHVVRGTVKIKNWAGQFGSYLSAFLADMLGFASYVPFVFFCLLGGRLCMRAPVWPWWRWCGFILLACCLAVASSAWNLGVGGIRSGGLLGGLLYGLSLEFFNPVGSALVWSFAFLLVLQLLFGFSWRQLIVGALRSLRQSFAESVSPEPAALQEQSVSALSLPAGNGPAAHQPALPDLEAASADPDPQTDGDFDSAYAAGGPALEMLLVRAQQEIKGRTAAGGEDPLPPGAVSLSLPSAAEQEPAGRGKDSGAGVGGFLRRLFGGRVQPRPADHGRGLQADDFAGVAEEAGPVGPDDSAGPAGPDYPAWSSRAGEPRSAVSASGTKAAGDPAAGARPRPAAAPGASQDYAGQPPWLADLEAGRIGVPAERSEPAANQEKPAGTHPVERRPTAGSAVSNDSGRSALAAFASGQTGKAGPVSEPFGSAGPAGPAGSAAVSGLNGRAATPANGPPAAPANGPAAAPAVSSAAAGPAGEDSVAESLVIDEVYRESSPPIRPKRLPAKLPPLELLQPVGDRNSVISREELEAKGRALMTCFKDFSIQAQLVRISPGPVVTSFEVRPAPGVKASRITGLSEDMALSLKAVSVRIQSPIPGTDTVGIEIPNERREVVGLRDLLASPSFQQSEQLLSMALGKDISGKPTISDLARMPHMLVAGATGTGKSVFLNSVLLSFLYKARPEELKLLLVDPKRIEMAVYADLPHLVHPIVTEMSLAKNALDWAVTEMERRYGDIARLGVRNVFSYNQKLKEMGDNRPAGLADLEPMPYLVIIIDELADLMLTAGKEVEVSIVRLAQLARAAGIHLIIATQRPSVDVVTGLIKANFPCRISFQVTSKHDSRTILDGVGAEHLLGRGDMLFKPAGGKLQRLHGAFVPDEDVAAVADYWRAQQAPDYRIDFSDWGAEGDSGGGSAGGGGPGDDLTKDPVYNEAVDFVRQQGKASISLIQRRFRIGFNRAARYIEQMEQDGIIGPADGSKPRVVR